MLGVSDATLRRMARAYERVYGQLPTDGRQARLYSDEVLKSLEAARKLVDKGRVPSFEKALEMMAAENATIDELLVVHTPTQQSLDLLRQELRLMIRQEVTAVLEAQHNEHIQELEKRNRYLEAELKRRDEGPPRRGWWLWGKR